MAVSESFLIQHSRKGYLYAILAPEASRVKFGFSERPLKRLDSLQTGSPEHLVLVGYWEGWQFQESQIHQLFQQYNVKLEWFQLSQPIANFIKAKTSVDVFSLIEIKSIDDLKRVAAAGNGQAPPLPEWINRQSTELLTSDEFQFKYLLDIATTSLVAKIRALRNLYEFEFDTVTVSLGKSSKGVERTQQKTRYPLKMWIAAAYFILIDAGLRVNAIRLLLDEAFRETFNEFSVTTE